MILGLLLVASAYVIGSLVVPLLLAGIIAYMFYPVFKWVNGYVDQKTVSSSIVTFIILLIITVPVLWLINTISRDAYTVYLQAKTLVFSGDLLENCGSDVCFAVKDFVDNSQVQYYLQEALKTASNSVIDAAGGFVFSIPERMISAFVTLFAAFYFIRDADKILDYIHEALISAAGDHKQKIFERLSEVLHAVVFGSLVIALAQGIVGGIGFFLFGVSSPVLWGLMMFVFALIPYLGTGVIWGPAGLILIMNGVQGDSTFVIWKGIGLLVYGAVLVSTVDNIIKPKVIGDRSRVHPVTVLVGIFGGISTMGIAGVFIGPVVLAMTLTLIEIYIDASQ